MDPLDYFASRSPSTIRLGLERMHAALEALGHPERRYSILQVAGTNGKGSTCAFAAQALLGHGLRVGRYTSPHLERVNERFWVSGHDITDEVLGQRISEVREGLGPAVDELTYFELGTVVALWHFAQAKVDAAVLEVGLGGRLDATTATQPQVTAIASISLDHTELLGHSVALVAAEKAGILKEATPVVVSAQRFADAEQVIRNHAQALRAPLSYEGEDFALEEVPQAGFRYRSARRSFSVPALSLAGRHQIHNAALALASVEELAEGRWRLDPRTLAESLGKTLWPGRLEPVARAPTVLVDGAHNPDGARALRQALQQLHPGARLHLVFGVLADKDTASIRQTLFPGCASIHLTRLPSPRSADPRDAEAEARRHAGIVSLHEEPQEAIEAAVKQAAAQQIELKRMGLSGERDAPRFEEPFSEGDARHPIALDATYGSARGDGALGVVVCAGSLILAGAARGWAAQQRLK